MTTGTVDTLAPKALILPIISGADTVTVSGARGMIGISGTQLVFCTTGFGWRAVRNKS